MVSQLSLLLEVVHWSRCFRTSNRTYDNTMVRLRFLPLTGVRWRQRTVRLKIEIKKANGQGVGSMGKIREHSRKRERFWVRGLEGLFCGGLTQQKIWTQDDPHQVLFGSGHPIGLQS
ncbi:hypothetical protein BDM02DRAFT_1292016 [Thelephora ganbajun]|uniref:Uncharacterized protein n=1 Tax=Thelephora ganbajun TaxID=370292 RepID=A0ACB6ZMA8_THEGA|nr:hypothetical protein BDM02DRAFT_1292016 [Thelephora ganbajun]